MGDRNEILEVLARYARALEERDGKAVAALFAPDGEFSLFGRYGRDDYVDAGVHVVGRDNIRAMIETGSLPPGRGMHYLTTDHIVVGGRRRRVLRHPGPHVGGADVKRLRRRLRRSVFVPQPEVNA